MELAILNTTIVTTDGTYTVKTISLDEAKELVLQNKDNIDSAIGHQSTADIMTTLLGVEIPMNRQLFEQQAGQMALVFKLNGRAAEGRILTVEEIEEMGYSFKIMRREH